VFAGAVPLFMGIERGNVTKLDPSAAGGVQVALLGDR